MIYQYGKYGWIAEYSTGGISIANLLEKLDEGQSKALNNEDNAMQGLSRTGGNDTQEARSIETVNWVCSQLVYHETEEQESGDGLS